MDVIAWIDSQSAFNQSLIAAAVFSATVWLARKLLNLLSSLGGATSKAYQRKLLLRHWIWRGYVNSNNIILRAEGFYFVALQALQWSLIAALIAVFFLAVNSLLERDWLWAACAWLTFNALFEAFQWSRDTSDPKKIERIDSEVLDEFVATLPEHHAQNFRKKDVG